jgi:hypothetical protein
MTKFPSLKSSLLKTRSLIFGMWSIAARSPLSMNVNAAAQPQCCAYEARIYRSSARLARLAWLINSRRWLIAPDRAGALALWKCRPL